VVYWGVSNSLVGVEVTEKIEDRGKRELEGLVLIYSQILVTWLILLPWLSLLFPWKHLIMSHKESSRKFHSFLQNILLLPFWLMGRSWWLLLWQGCFFLEVWWCFREKSPDLKLPSNYGFFWLNWWNDLMEPKIQCFRVRVFFYYLYLVH